MALKLLWSQRGSLINALQLMGSMHWSDRFGRLSKATELAFSAEEERTQQSIDSELKPKYEANSLTLSYWGLTDLSTLQEISL